MTQVWTGTLGAPAVSNGVVDVGSDDHKLYGFDATGSSGCTGTPKVCQPLAFAWTGGVVQSSPTIADKVVFVGSNDGSMHVFGAPATYVDVTGAPLSAMSSSPALDTAFSPTTHDYAVSCNNGDTFNLTAASGTITVNGQSGSSVSTTVDGIEPSQAVVIQAPDAANPSGATTEYWVRCLPPDFPAIQVTQGATRASPGYHFYGTITPTPAGSYYAMILDGNGTPVWYEKTPSAAVDVQWLGNDTVAFYQASSWSLLNLSTLTTQTVAAPVGPTDEHELLTEPNGDRMLIATPVKSGVDLSSLPGGGPNESILDCEVQEINPEGQLVWSWTASDHVGVNEVTSSLFKFVTIFGEQFGDVYHCNSIAVDATGTQVLISLRNTSAVYDVNKATGDVMWKLSANSNVHDPGEQALAIKGDPETAISGQHDARFEANNDVSLFDDHTALTGAARGAQYHIDTTAGTATLDFSYARPDGNHSLATGSFRRYSDGDNVIAWGFNTGSGFTEIDNSGNVLLDVVFPNGEMGYRALKVPTSSVDVNLLRRVVGASPQPPSGGGSAPLALARAAPTPGA